MRTGKIGKLQVKEPKMEDFLILHTKIYPGGSEVKSVFLQCGRPGFDPWVGKIPWRRKWQPIPVFLPGEPMDGGAWWATIHGVAKSQTQLNNFTFTFTGKRTKWRTFSYYIQKYTQNRLYLNIRLEIIKLLG